MQEINLVTRGRYISEVRNQLKAVNADSRLTDRFIYSIIDKHLRWLIKRETDKLKIMRSDYLFQTIKCIDVIEAPVIDDCCGIVSKCKVNRTRIKLPKIYEDGSGSSIIKSVFSVDGSYEFSPVSIQAYMRKVENPHSKYDKSRYYYYNSGYLYFPKSPIKMIMIKGYFEEDVKKYSACNKNEDDENQCTSKQDEFIRMPAGIQGELMDFVMKDLFNYNTRLQSDNRIDKNDNTK